jgi:hypothetical protein
LVVESLETIIFVREQSAIEVLASPAKRMLLYFSRAAALSYSATLLSSFTNLKKPAAQPERTDISQRAFSKEAIDDDQSDETGPDFQHPGDVMPGRNDYSH